LIKGLNRDFRILHEGIYPAAQLRLNLLPGKRTYSPELRSLIRQACQEAKLDPALDLYNGRVLSLLSSSEENGALAATVQETDFKAFYGTNISNFKRIGNKKLCANALAACAVVESSEGSILIGRRSARVAEGRGEWHVPGGTLELRRNRRGLSSWLGFFCLPPDEALNPLVQMGCELTEEFGIRAQDVITAECLGLGENLLIGKPEYLCRFRLKPGSTVLGDRLEHAPDRTEHDEAVLLPMEEIVSFTQTYEVSPIGRAALYLYLRLITGQARGGSDDQA
jgi:hypothetical protein